MLNRGQRLCALVIAVVSLLILMTISACSPIETGPPGMVDVEAHLDLFVPYVPEGCDPVGLDGDGRGSVVGAAFDCTGGTTLRVERFDSTVNEDPVPGSPAETSPGRVEWREGSTGDVIRVVSDGFDVGVLLRVAESIEVAP